MASAIKKTLPPDTLTDEEIGAASPNLPPDTLTDEEIDALGSNPIGGSTGILKGSWRNVSPYAPGKAPITKQLSQLEQAQNAYDVSSGIGAPSISDMPSMFGKNIENTIVGAGKLLVHPIDTTKDAAIEAWKNLTSKQDIPATTGQVGQAMGMAAGFGAQPSGYTSAFSQTIKPPPPPPVVPPARSIKDIKDIVSKMPTNIELPTAQRLDSVVQQTLKDPSVGFNQEYLPTKFHRFMLESPNKKLVGEMIKTLPSDVSDSLQQFDMGMKQEGVKALKNVSNKITGRQPLPAFEAGYNAINDAKDLYAANKSQLAPNFDYFNSIRIPRVKTVDGFMSAMIENVPELQSLMKTNQFGQIELAPWRPRSGLSQTEYGVAKSVVDDLNSMDTINFKDMQRLREYMRKSVNPLHPEDTRNLSNMRKGTLDYMDYLVNTYSPRNAPPSVIDTFKKYAINESNLKNFEDMIGGTLETAKPETLVNKIFANSKNIEKAKNFLGEQKVQELAGDLLYTMEEKATQNGILSPQKLASSFKNKKAMLQQSVDPRLLKNYEDLTDFMRLTSDLPSSNPSGTAKAILTGQDVKAPGYFSGLQSTSLKQIPQKMYQNFKEVQKTKESGDIFNKILETGKLESKKSKPGDGLIQRYNKKLKGPSRGIVGIEKIGEEQK